VGLSRLGSALAALSLLAACGAPDNRPYDDADVLFATEMIPHHQQAVAMAKLAPAHGASRPVQEVASQISAEQIPEIAQLRGMLAEWDQAAGPTAAPMAGMPGMGGGTALGAAAPGMMTDDEMARLESAGGPAFDHAFLQMMIIHHQGALTMAKTELADGRDPEAMLMAQNISDAQQASIELMQRCSPVGDQRPAARRFVHTS
jgi:uncharacterized protein (DUF305 family)